MKFRGRHVAQVSHDRWLVSYADFVTLLFAFFVVLYASAQVDKQRALQLSDAIRSGFQSMGILDSQSRSSLGAPGQSSAPLRDADSGQTAGTREPNLDQIQAELERALATEIVRREVGLHRNAEGLVLSLREVGFFDSGSAVIKPASEAAVARIAAILRNHACSTRIEGHTDNVPIHTAQFASNWELSTARATGLVRLLIEKYEVAPSLLSAAGYAEFRPASSDATEEGRQRNRRVDLIILRSDRKAFDNQSAGTSAKPDADIAIASPEAETRRPIPAAGRRQSAR